MGPSGRPVTEGPTRRFRSGGPKHVSEPNPPESEGREPCGTDPGSYLLLMSTPLQPWTETALLMPWLAPPVFDLVAG